MSYFLDLPVFQIKEICRALMGKNPIGIADFEIHQTIFPLATIVK